ncbi:pilus assembly protein FimV [Luteibacter jiangsuensis]|uniref:Pilus assembly protein FimV n=1 Tax=Luteibacter jiangsuensis TaxID=637577 RepID=A0ABT9SUJ4_9GAMM|nr:FimV/HubP family polar landmark protein [Luteibacter jiangsuensis]MDQ0008653.1 pilus assembly protein FimV [Luteibacter jiangsuensis]
MNRTLKLSIMLALATWGSQALAQNLGPVQVRSTMDQPLAAEIPLTGVSGNLDNVHVALASEEAFTRAGLNRGGLPVALNFAVGKNASGQPVVRVSSAEPVRDTYLDFLVEVSTGGNKVVREVTMLLDPPGTPVNSAVAASAAQPSRTSEVPSRVPSHSEARPSRAEAPTKAAPAKAAPAAAAPGDTYGPVQRGQTLSTIARQHAGGADMNQMLVALQKANPEAFYRDNMNALKTGAVLRIPSTDDVQALSAASALAEVRRQNESWRAGTTRAPSVVADAASSPAGQGEGKPAAPATDRLAIVPSKDGGDAASTRAGSKGGTGDAQVVGLKQQLATSQESVASLKQQGEELKSRIGDLEEINSKNQRLLSLKDSEIAELQRKLAEAQKAPGQPAVASAPTPAAAATSPAPAPTAPAAASAPSPVVASATPAASAPAPASTVAISPLKEPSAATPPAAKPVTKRAPVAPVPVEEDPWYMQPWAWGGGAIVILLLLVAAVFGRKKPKAAATAGATSLADRFGQEHTFGGFGEPSEIMDQDQREILDALAEHPDDIGLHLELVSLYYGRRDVEHFEAAAEAMFAHVADPDQPEWREVMMMGEDLAPSHPLFGGVPVDEVDEPYEDTYTASRPRNEDEVAALEEFDLGNYVTGPDEEEPTQKPAPQKHSEYHFNFDLTPVQRAEADRRPSAPDVFDVDAPESPYAEPHETNGSVAGNETVAKDEERSTWSFEDEHDLASRGHAEPATTTSHVPRFDEPTFPDEEPLEDHGPESFSDDPVDTKLDLARAYLDMGDAEGARLMLDEVLAEGSQMQKDTARRILNDIV